MESDKKNDGRLRCIGNYSVRNIILGKGNFATVYFAVHNLIGTAVALKVIDKRQIKEDYVIKNLDRESKILCRLKHGNIVKLYETLQSEDFFCLSLELVKGVSMSEYLKVQPHHRVKESKSKSLFYQILSGVRHIHENTVIHRDLKLENLMIENESVIKIVDFGLSNIYYPCKRLRTHCGSVEYAAPELFRSRGPYSTAVDMWSLGVVLYAMVVGRMPFPYPRNSSSVHSRRQTLLASISKGLGQQHRDSMKYLSCECWTLLHSLLEPDQFKRMTLDAAISSNWFTTDKQLKSMLPKSSSLLYKEFDPEVVIYLSKTVRLPEDYVRNHVRTYKSDDLSAMYNIISDSLVKDAMYPPKNRDNSYILRFRQRMEAYRKEERLREGLKLSWKNECSKTESQISTPSDTESVRDSGNKKLAHNASSTSEQRSSNLSKKNLPTSQKVAPTPVYRPTSQGHKIAKRPDDESPLPQVHHSSAPRPATKSYRANRPALTKSLNSPEAKSEDSAPVHASPKCKSDNQGSSYTGRVYHEYKNTSLKYKNCSNSEQQRKPFTRPTNSTRGNFPMKTVAINIETETESCSNLEIHKEFRNTSVPKKEFKNTSAPRRELPRPNQSRDPYHRPKNVALEERSSTPKKPSSKDESYIPNANSPFLSTPIELSKCSITETKMPRSASRGIATRSPLPPRMPLTANGDARKSRVPLIKSRVPRFANQDYPASVGNKAEKDTKSNPETESVSKANSSSRVSASESAFRRGLPANVKYGVPPPGFGAPAAGKNTRNVYFHGDGQPNPCRVFSKSRPDSGVSKQWRS